MKKVVGIMMAFLMCLSLSGCGKSDEDVVKDVQSKIEKAGWKIEHDPDAGTAVDYLNVITDEEDIQFALTLNKEEKKIVDVAFTDKSSFDSRTLSYNVEEKKDNSFIYHIGSLSCMFNPDTEEVNELVTTADDCEEEAPELVEETKAARDRALKKADITLDDLYTWGKWYHQEND